METRTVRTSELVDKKGSAPRLKRLAGRSGKPGARKAPPGEPRKVAYLYILPALLFYGAFVLLPIVQELRASSEYPIRHRVKGVEGPVRQAAWPRGNSMAR